MHLSGEKSEVLHFGRKKQMHRYRVDSTWLNSNNSEKELGVLVNCCLSMIKCKQGAALPKKANKVWVASTEGFLFFIFF